MASERRLIPATATNMSPWIIEVLKAGPRERTELLGAVDALARAEGFQALEISALKKALMKLRKAGSVLNIRKGWWQLAKQIDVVEAETPRDLAMGKRSISVLREIGHGAEFVYVLQFNDEVERARATGHSAWNCKIGRSKNATQRLLNNVSSTYLVQSPEIGLMIRCDQSAIVEAAIHCALKYCGQHIKTSPGNEWFLSSPSRVAAFYLDWLKACSDLKLTA